MALDTKQTTTAIRYLTDLPSPHEYDPDSAFGPTKTFGSTAGLAAKLGIDEAAAQEIEEELTEIGLITRTAGYRGIARYNLSDAGEAYMVLAKKGRPMTATEVLKAIPSGPFAGDRITIQFALQSLEVKDVVASADGGATFSIA